MDMDETNIEDHPLGEQSENMLLRLVYLLLIAIMISLAQTILGVATVVQFVVMLINQKQPNQRLARFGTHLGM